MSQPRHVDPESVDAFLAARGPGDAISGRVDRIVSFGAFIELRPGVHGLLHESEWSGRPELGEQINVRIAGVDREQRRISLTPAYAEAPRLGRQGPGPTSRCPGDGMLAFDARSGDHRPEEDA